MNRVARNVALEMALHQRSIGRRIAELRERRHMTQEALASEVEVTLRAVQKWEAGGGVQFSNLQKLATALKTSPEHILGEDTPDPFAAKSQLDRIEEKLDTVLERQLQFIERLRELDPVLFEDGELRELMAQAVEVVVQSHDEGTTAPAAERRAKRTRSAA